MKVFLTDGTDTGLAFHGVPSGHEFTSFILGLYNASGPGQKIDEQTQKEIENIKYFKGFLNPVMIAHIVITVFLAGTMVLMALGS